MPGKNKVQKMLKKIKAFLDSDYREQVERREKIIDVLKRLKKRTKAIGRQLESVDDDEVRSALLDELELIKAQRKKAIQVIKTIKEET
mgnify:CR=1 FL=1